MPLHPFQDRFQRRARAASTVGHRALSWARASIMLLALLGFLGCARSKPANFYLLAVASQPAGETGGGTRLMVGVGPVKLPEYLNRPQIVTRSTENQLRLSELNRWAEPLEENFKRELAEGLAERLGQDRIVTFPWRPSQQYDRQLALTVLSFDGMLGGEIQLAARAVLLDAAGGELANRRFTIAEPAGSDYPAYVQALSRALDRLNGELAAMVSQ